MKFTFTRILQLSITILLLAGCSTSESDVTYKVTEVIDGDTFKIQYNDREETIRLLLVDTPETVHPQKPVQPFGKEASNWMKQELSGERVELELDVSERGKYGRILAYVYNEEGEMINELLLEKGLARVAYIYPPNTKYVDRFQEIQEEAQLNERGIWSIENYVTEDGFTSDSRPEVQPNSDCSIKGNINSDDEKIYHMPDGAYYDVTKPELMFCTESEAQQSGFRPSKR
ncbi:thermonuclease family protein [Alkalihalobacillus sp. AL-G]|uniref:thermonuclease family protein n=1 Tax=Alkalihalobacillus sp. AL-G TaxID=2926399 RepID=UPI00272B04D6|nr:thermonuclease family protein [Alkalihalobacillus sp. AL-G]WLD95275.1 thermonuclease family protein [Alkalihalobacillus sp. AL-G]